MISRNSNIPNWLPALFIHGDCPVAQPRKILAVLPRPLLAILVFALPVLVVVFAVAAGGYVLLDSAHDQVAIRTLRPVTYVLLALIVSDALLLVGVLGWQAYVANDAAAASHANPANIRDDSDTNRLA